MSGERINTIGIVGGGQLGRMLTEAAIPLGYKVVVLEKNPNSPAAQVGAQQIEGDLHDEGALRYLGEKADVITWEIEHIGADILFDMENEGVDVQPSPAFLRLIQDKVDQKKLLNQSGIPTAPYYEVKDSEDLKATINRLGPVVVKTRTGGFDGRGNLALNTPDWEKILDTLGDRGLYAEQLLKLQKELSVIVVRDKDGKISPYPTIETIYTDQICDLAVMPARITQKQDESAQELAREVVKQLGGAGVFAIEMFLTEDDQILVNEIAPRVHNSGHLTIEASVTSQFQQHIRAITGLPLGRTERMSPAAMANILYGPITFGGLKRALGYPYTYLHLYGKEPRVDGSPRKIGHITTLADNPNEAIQMVIEARKDLLNVEK